MPVQELTFSLSTEKCKVKCTIVFALSITQGRREEDKNVQ
jgi:hypothetical protein